MCQPNELKREIKKQTGGPNGGPSNNLGGTWPIQVPLRIATGGQLVHCLPSVTPQGISVCQADEVDKKA